MSAPRCNGHSTATRDAPQPTWRSCVSALLRALPGGNSNQSGHETYPLESYAHRSGTLGGSDPFDLHNRLGCCIRRSPLVGSTNPSFPAAASVHGAYVRFATFRHMAAMSDRAVVEHLQAPLVKSSIRVILLSRIAQSWVDCLEGTRPTSQERPPTSKHRLPGSRSGTGMQASTS